MPRKARAAGRTPPMIDALAAADARMVAGAADVTARTEGGSAGRLRWISGLRRFERAQATVALVGFTVLMLASSLAAEELPTGEQMERRRARVAAMSAAEKEKLRRNHQRFAKLKNAQREELRDLYETVFEGPEQQRLAPLLRLYHAWMQSLPAGERLQLLALPADERVRAIKDLVQKQERERFQALVEKSLSVQDRDAIINWLAELALERLPLSEQQRLRLIEQPLRQRTEIMSLFRRRIGGSNDARFLERLNPTAAERQALIDRLSAPAQATINAAKDDPEKRELIQRWISAAIFSRLGNRPRIPPEMLEAYFDGLDAEDQDYLNNLPPDRKEVELERLFLRSRGRRPGSFFPPQGANRRRGGGRFRDGKQP